MVSLEVLNVLAQYRWTSHVSLGVTHELASTLDILPTIARLAGAKLPKVLLDGVDMTEILINRGMVEASLLAHSQRCNIVKTKEM